MYIVLDIVTLSRNKSNYAIQGFSINSFGSGTGELIVNVGPICISVSVADLVFQLGDYKLIESHQSEVYNFFCIHDFDAVVNQTTKEISQPKKIS